MMIKFVSFALAAAAELTAVAAANIPRADGPNSLFPRQSPLLSLK
jgi:hypothetical protein